MFYASRRHSTLLRHFKGHSCDIMQRLLQILAVTPRIYS